MQQPLYLLVMVSNVLCYQVSPLLATPVIIKKRLTGAFALKLISHLVFVLPACLHLHISPQYSQQT